MYSQLLGLFVKSLKILSKQVRDVGGLLGLNQLHSPGGEVAALAEGDSSMEKPTKSIPKVAPPRDDFWNK